VFACVHVCVCVGGGGGYHDISRPRPRQTRTMFVFPFVCFVRPHSRDSLFRFTKDGKHLLWVSLVRDAKVFWLDVGVLVCNPHEREESVSSRRRVALRGNHPVSAFVRVSKVVQSAARCGMVW
jgi:hypothetical protein